ncbi:unnamed protein product [Nesidiocoris tenuis]|uniref:Uncharacterized protein n=1 Tax=Nesidiocoris tenuis TaxID=355587 RepID=A0A6H5HLN3_9HEMI|nr:unnamed protein product [Nesidiocoris tenuis]
MKIIDHLQYLPTNIQENDISTQKPITPTNLVSKWDRPVQKSSFSADQFRSDSFSYDVTGKELKVWRIGKVDFHVDDVIFGNTRIPRTTPASLSVGGSWNYEQANLTLPSARSPAARSTAKSAGGKESSAVRTVSTRTADCAIGEMRERGNRCHPAAEGVIPLRRGTRGAEDDLAVRPWGAGRAPSGDR